MIMGGMEGGINWEIGTDIYTLLNVKQKKNKIDNRDLLQSTGNLTQCSVMTYMGKESKRVDICICITDSLCRTPETNTTWSINYVSIKTLNVLI